MDYKNYSEQELLRIKKFLTENHGVTMESTIEMLDVELKHRATCRDKEHEEFKELMLDYIGRCFRVNYDSMLSIDKGKSFTVYYKINDVAVIDKATSTYNVILDAETITIHDNRVEYCNRGNDLRLDNTDIESKGKEISLDIFEDIKSNFDKLLEDK